MVPRAAAATAMLVYSLLSSDLVSSSQARKRKKKKIDQDMKQSAVFVLSWTASSIFCCVEVKRVAMRPKETHVMQRDSQLQANERAGLLEMRHAHACNGNWGSVGVSQLRSS